jgi:hypothetical protein
MKQMPLGEPRVHDFLECKASETRDLWDLWTLVFIPRCVGDVLQTVVSVNVTI